MRYGKGWAHDPTFSQQKRAKPTHNDPEDDMKVDRPRHITQGQMDNSGQVSQEVERNGRIRLHRQANGNHSQKRVTIQLENFMQDMVAPPQQELTTSATRRSGEGLEPKSSNMTDPPQDPPEGVLGRGSSGRSSEHPVGEYSPALEPAKVTACSLSFPWSYFPYFFGFPCFLSFQK